MAEMSTLTPQVEHLTEGNKEAMVTVTATVAVTVDGIHCHAGRDD